LGRPPAIRRLSTLMRQCLSSGEAFEGRAGKKFCSSYCRSAYHYRNKQADSLSHQIDRQLKQNRQILKKYNQAGKSTVRQEILLKEGFNPRYFTHFWKAKNGNVYLFCRVPAIMNTDTSKKAKTDGRPTAKPNICSSSGRAIWNRFNSG